MNSAKEKVLDRIEQSFEIFKNHFVALILPLFALEVGVYMIFYGASLQMMSGININHFELDSLTGVLVYFLPMVLIYLIMQMVIIIGIYKTISDAYHGREYRIVENYQYAFTKLFEVFKTYYFMFVYVYLLPSLVFIGCGLFFLYLLQSGGLILSHSGLEGSLLTGGFRASDLILPGLIYILVSLIYIIYRGVKATFAIPSAIDSDDFTNTNFKQAVAITKNQWWRIVGNIILVSLIVTLLTGVFSGVFHSLLAPPSSNFSFGTGSQDTGVMMNEISKIFEKNLTPQTLLVTTIDRLFAVLMEAFLFVFVFLFYQRLKDEANTQELDVSSQQDKEMIL